MEPSRLVRQIGSALAPVALVVIIFLAGRACIDSLTEPEFSPLSIRRLVISPEVLHPGETITLLDGVCNNTDKPVQASIYLGAQSETTSSFASINVDLLTKPDETGRRVPVTDTPEGRVGRVFEPGCTATDPLMAPLPAVLTASRTWRIKAHIRVVGEHGEVQDIVKLSNRFVVDEPETP